MFLKEKEIEEEAQEKGILAWQATCAKRGKDWVYYKS